MKAGKLLARRLFSGADEVMDYNLVGWSVAWKLWCVCVCVCVCVRVRVRVVRVRVVCVCVCVLCVCVCVYLIELVWWYIC